MSRALSFIADLAPAASVLPGPGRRVRHPRLPRDKGTIHTLPAESLSEQAPGRSAVRRDGVRDPLRRPGGAGPPGRPAPGRGPPGHHHHVARAVDHLHRRGQQTELTRMHATGEYTIADLMEVFSVGRATVYRTLKRATSVGGADAARGSGLRGPRRPDHGGERQDDAVQPAREDRHCCEPRSRAPGPEVHECRRWPCH